MNELERACAIVAAKDSSPLRRVLFEQLASQRPLIVAARSVWRRVRGGPGALAILGATALKAYGEVRLPPDRGPVLAVARYRNEHRQFEVLEGLIGAAFDRVEFDAGGILAPQTWLGLGDTGPWGQSAVRLLRSASSRDFLVAMRIASTIGFALRFERGLRRGSRWSVVLVSSDANPYAVALVAAARVHGRKTCFVTHGHVAEGPAPLAFDLSIVDGERVREVYRRAGPIEGRVVLRGSEGTTRPMQTEPLRRGVRSLGVFLPIVVDWPQLGRALGQLRRQLQPRSIVLRLHPNLAMRPTGWERHLDLSGVRVSDGDRVLDEDAGACDLVVSGNSSAHLTVLKYGVPAAYLPGIDPFGDDYYGFIAGGILPPPGPLVPEALADFYGSDEWARRFGDYDAGYPDRQVACDAAVANALRSLIADAP